MSTLKDLMGIPLLPINAVAHGESIDSLLAYLHWFMLALFVFWTGFFFYTLVRFRKARNPKADYDGLKSKFPKYLEAAVVAIEVVLLFGFSIPLWSDWTQKFPDERDATVVRVVAEQYAWNFHYAGPDGKFGMSKPGLVDVQFNPLGLDRANDPYAIDDVVSATLYLPVNRPVITHITSKDVIHSFGIPALRVKQDANPGMSIPQYFTPTLEGKYLIACSQLCGQGHAKMRAVVEVIPEPAFNKWLATGAPPAATVARAPGP